MPASLALVKAFWDGAERQRAISMWSIGSWGGSGLCSLVGGLISQNFGWRSIFWVAIGVNVLGLWMIRGAPESKADTMGDYKFDLSGVLAFMVTMVALQVAGDAGQQARLDAARRASVCWRPRWCSAAVFRMKSKASNAFFDFSLFRNSTYTGATISNFLINGTAGTLIVSLQLVQLGGNMNAQQAGFLTLGYAIAIIAFIRVGEKLLQRFGPRKPMIWGCLITGLAILLVSPPTCCCRTTRSLPVVGYTLFGVGLAFYATPSTDAALSNLPADQSVRGRASTRWLRRSAPPSAWRSPRRFSRRSAATAPSVHWLDGVITFHGRQDNLAVREAAIVALGFNVLMVVVAIISIMLTVPKGTRTQA